MSNKIYLHDIPMETFLDYFNSEVTGNTLAFSPKLRDLTSTEIKAYFDYLTANVPNYNDKDNKQTNMLDQLSKDENLPLYGYTDSKMLYRIVNISKTIYNTCTYSTYPYYKLFVIEDKSKNVLVKKEEIKYFAELTDDDKKYYTILDDIYDDYFSYKAIVYKCNTISHEQTDGSNTLAAYIVKNIPVQTYMNESHTYFDYITSGGQIYSTKSLTSTKSKIEEYAEKLRDNLYSITDSNTSANSILYNTTEKDTEKLNIYEYIDNTNTASILLTQSHNSKLYYVYKKYKSPSDAEDKLNDNIARGLTLLPIKSDIILNTESLSDNQFVISDTIYELIGSQMCVDYITDFKNPDVFEPFNLYYYQEFSQQKGSSPKVSNEYKLYDYEIKFNKTNCTGLKSIKKYRLAVAYGGKQYPLYKDTGSDAIFSIWIDNKAVPLYILNIGNNSYYSTTCTINGNEIIDVLGNNINLENSLEYTTDGAIRNIKVNDNTYSLYQDIAQNKIYSIWDFTYIDFDNNQTNDEYDSSITYINYMKFDDSTKQPILVPTRFDVLPKSDSDVSNDLPVPTTPTLGISISLVDALNYTSSMQSVIDNLNKNSVIPGTDNLEVKPIDETTLSTIIDEKNELKNYAMFITDPIDYFFDITNSAVYSKSMMFCYSKNILDETTKWYFSSLEDLKNIPKELGKYVTLSDKDTNNARGRIVTTKSNKTNTDKYLDNIMSILKYKGNSNPIFNENDLSIDFLSKVYNYAQSLYSFFSEENRFTNGYNTLYFSRLSSSNDECYCSTSSSPKKILMYKYDDEDIPESIQYQDKTLKIPEEKSINSVMKARIYEEINSTTPYTRILNYKKYATINELENALIEEAEDQLRFDLDDTRDSLLIKDTYDTNETKPTCKMVTNLEFKDALVDFLSSLYYNNIYIPYVDENNNENTVSFYLKSFNDFYSSKITAPNKEYKRYVAKPVEKTIVPEFVTTTAELKSYAEKIKQEFNRGMRFR